MNALTRPGAPSLLRLIVELRDSDLPSNDVYLEIVSEREAELVAAELVDLEHAGLIAWSERGEQWTPTLQGLLVAMSLPAFEPGLVTDLAKGHAECA